MLYAKNKNNKEQLAKAKQNRYFILNKKEHTYKCALK